MAGVVQHLERGGAPPLRKTPGGFDRAAHVETTMEEYRWDPVKDIDVVDQFFVVQERRVSPIMSDQPGEAKSECAVLISRVRSAPGSEGDMGVLPRTPFSGSHLPNGRILIEEHLGVGADQPEMSKRLGYRLGEAMPLLGNIRATPPVTQSTSRRVVVVTNPRIMPATRSGWRSA